MNFQQYLIKNTNHNRNGKETAKFRDHIKIIEIYMKDYLFSGDDQFQLLNFLSELTEECDTLHICQAEITGPTILAEVIFQGAVQRSVGYRGYGGV